MASTPDLQWSIPSVVDGLNRGQRKILFSSFKKNLVVEHANVARLAGYVVEDAAYDHGQKSIENTIIAMAQDFVGSNNINLFEPNGQFGSRLQGGEDHADGCYIHTCLSPVARLLFREDDDIFLNYLEDSGRSIEPIWYIPIIPLVLVNGSRGCESNVPSYNARDIIANLRRLLNNECMEPMDPWYRGFKGIIEKISTTDDGTTYTTTGAIEAVDKTALRITELPIHCWTMDYKEFLASLDRWNDNTKEFFIEDIRTCGDHMSVEIELSLDEKNMKIAMQEGLEKKFNLTNTIGTTNMHLFDRTGLNIRKYKAPEEILEEFFDLRLEYYAKRKKAELESLDLDLWKVTNKVRFILGVGHGDITVMNREIEDLALELCQKGFTPFPENSESLEAGKGGVRASDYEYLLSIPISSMAREKVQEFCAEKCKLEEKIEEWRKTTPRSLWMKDLDALEVELDRLDIKDAENEAMARARRAKACSRFIAKYSAKKQKAAKKATANDGEVGDCEPVKVKPEAQKKKTQKVAVIESVDDEDNEVPLLEARPSANNLDTSSEEVQQKGKLGGKGPSKRGAGRGRKPAAEKPPKAATVDGAATRKRTRAAAAAQGQGKDAKAEEESGLLPKPSAAAAAEENTSSVTSPVKKARRTRGRSATSSSTSTGDSLAEPVAPPPRAGRPTRGNMKKAKSNS